MNSPNHTELVNTRQSSGNVIAAWFVLGLLVFYVLSTGPAMKLHEAGHMQESTLNTVYAPIVWLNKHCPPVAAAFRWYFGIIWKIPLFK